MCHHNNKSGTGIFLIKVTNNCKKCFINANVRMTDYRQCQFKQPYMVVLSILNRVDPLIIEPLLASSNTLHSPPIMCTPPDTHPYDMFSPIFGCMANIRSINHLPKSTPVELPTLHDCIFKQLL